MANPKTYFKQISVALDRFRTGDQPSQATFFSLFDSICFRLDKADTASVTGQGLVKCATDQEAINKTLLVAYTDGMSRIVRPHQLPDVIAKDASIVITEVIWDATDGVIVGSIVVGHDCRKMYQIKAAPAALDGIWKSIGGGGTFDGTIAVPAFTTGATNTASPISTRKISSGKVAIRGICNTTAPWVSGDVLFTYPSDYCPTVIVPIYVGTRGLIAVKTNGDVVIDGFAGLSQIVIPETQFSLD